MFMVNPNYIALKLIPTGSCSSHVCHLAEGMWIIFPQNGNSEQAYGKKNIHLTYIELGYVPNIPRMTLMIIANLHHHEHKIVADDKA